MTRHDATKRRQATTRALAVVSLAGFALVVVAGDVAVAAVLAHGAETHASESEGLVHRLREAGVAAKVLLVGGMVLLGWGLWATLADRRRAKPQA